MIEKGGSQGLRFTPPHNAKHFTGTCYIFTPDRLAFFHKISLDKELYSQNKNTNNEYMSKFFQWSPFIDRKAETQREHVPCSRSLG